MGGQADEDVRLLPQHGSRRYKLCVTCTFHERTLYRQGQAQGGANSENMRVYRDAGVVKLMAGHEIDLQLLGEDVA